MSQADRVAVRSLGLFAYNLKLAVRNIRRNPVLSALMVAAIGIGIGACMAMVTVNYRFAADPIPQKSDVLHFIRLDSWSPDQSWQQSGAPPPQLTYLDATALLEADRAVRQAAMAGATVAVEPSRADERPFFVSVRATTGDFFGLFDVPFAYGGGWGDDADAADFFATDALPPMAFETDVAYLRSLGVDARTAD